MPEVMSRIWTLNPGSWMLMVRHLRVTPRMRGWSLPSTRNGIDPAAGLDCGIYHVRMRINSSNMMVKTRGESTAP